MITQEIHNHIQRQRDFYASGKSREVSYRIESLKKLRTMIQRNERRIMDALKQDLHKSAFESYESEIGLVLSEIDYHLRHVRRWSRTKRVSTPFVLLPSNSRIRHEPHGLVLIMAPWNYPFGLLITPLVGAISGGNCAVLKPANYTPTVSNLIKEMIEVTFPSDYISVFTGGRDMNQALLQERYDYMFFTGGPVLGKVVANAAAKHFTPLTLELGGKSPCIVDEDANLKRAARRIVWGKFLNNGQTCIAPDHLYVHHSVKESLMDLMKAEITRQWGTDPQQSPDLARMVNTAAFDRVSSYLENAAVITGGRTDRDDLYIEPTLIEHVHDDMPVMQNEIFGPVLPVLEFDDLFALAKELRIKDKPLALYYFGHNKKKAGRFMDQVDSGDTCVNDVLVHFGNDKLPFGGVGNSGMGAYHGKFSFDTFSRQRSVVTSPTLFDMPFKFAPYKKKLALIKRFL